MSQANTTLTPRELALKRCQENIDWYDRAKRRQHGGLVMDEVTDWRTQMQKAAGSPSRSGQEG